MATLKDFLPWTSSPLIVNAPMAGFAGGALAAAVTLAGGLGLIGSTPDMDHLRKEFRIASEAVASNGLDSISGTLPIGVGLLPFRTDLDEAMEVVVEFRPRVVWLLAAKELDQYVEWAAAARKVSPETKIWVQVGSVAAALHIARTTKPDVLCLQGADAGGHGFEKGAGIISLIPEVSDTLAREGYSYISLVASGGIADGRGAAAALALGAHGVVLGTRFLAAKEVIIHPKYQAAVLQARDGGQMTMRSKLFDQLSGPSIWPVEYDGRSLAVQSHKDYVSGRSLEGIQKAHKEAVDVDDKGYDTDMRGRAAIWAGTGVGLVNSVEDAAKIVETVRNVARDVLSKVAKL